MNIAGNCQNSPCECPEYVECKFCTEDELAELARLHQDQYVCDSCWDERLAITA